MTVVQEFHEAYGLPAPNQPPLLPDIPNLQLRLRLISEEFEEVKVELTKMIGMRRIKGTLEARPDDFLPVYRDLLKELCDLRYVVEGTAVSLGLPIEDAYTTVHGSNMSKLGPDGQPIRDEGGKVLKGPNYQEADMIQHVPDFIEVTA